MVTMPSSLREQQASWLLPRQPWFYPRLVAYGYFWWVFVFDFDISHNHRHLLFMDIDSAILYAISFLLAGAESVPEIH